MKKTSEYLLAKKESHQKIVALTCYDYPTAVLEDQAGVDWTQTNALDLSQG